VYTLSKVSGNASDQNVQLRNFLPTTDQFNSGPFQVHRNSRLSVAP